MNRILSVLLLLCLLPLAQTIAQDAGQNTAAGHLVAYINDAQQVVALNPTTGEQRVLVQTNAPGTASTAFGLTPSPDGAHLAVYLTWEESGADGMPIAQTGMLYVVRVADGQVVLEQSLLPADFVYPGIEIGNPAFETLRALGELAWSPDGKLLAFVSAQAGNADVWLLDTNDQTTRPLEAGSYAAADLSWNPDSTALVYTDIESFGTGGGLSVGGSGVIDIASGTLTPPALDARALEMGFTLVGWQDARTFLYSPLDYLAGADGFFAYNLDTQAVTTILPAQTLIAPPIYDPSTNSALIVSPEMGMEMALAPGLHLWNGSEVSLVQAGSFYYGERLRPGTWIIATPEGAQLYENGALRPLPAQFYGAFPSPQQDAVVLYREDGVYVSRLSADDASLIWAGEAQIPVWSPDGVYFYSFGFTDAGAGLMQFDVVNRSYTLLDSRMSATSPVAVLPIQ